MKVAVWDTYVIKKDGSTMHFDVLVPDIVKDERIVYNFGRDYLKTKNQEGQNLSADECSYCHIEEASDLMLEGIEKQGYYIVEMENCN